jgi:hypothetical protein
MMEAPGSETIPSRVTQHWKQRENIVKHVRKSKSRVALPYARKNKRATHNMQQTNTAITETQEAK